jgi:hypothetical protein
MLSRSQTHGSILELSKGILILIVMCGDLHVDSIWEERKNPSLMIISQSSYVVRISDAWKQASRVLELSKGMLLVM